MTPFMLRVAEYVGADEDEIDHIVAPMPATRISQKIAASHGADKQVAIRSLAEQLVCEANAVLGHASDHLTLTDETLPDELAFEVGFRGRAARVSTTFADGTAYGRLVGDGFESELPQELNSADDVPDLLMRLIIESGTPHHTVNG
ncbi:hypothetical protein [Nostocoides australiense]|uniref:Uncharacterized protein n=1 Tax=Nostocoides australiense Ben110 TaxID=1193182 RepID=W6JYZ2_9MICO|nr:hypothetical protein [Tetrasphaera australiensis]MCA0293434.1 hypothetical protein [Actinomycetota bacterium]CCH73941.1 conserved hypothetical protein [Tetrasphaera australiensis Ben110]HPF80639.1 hypothetical protein [Tetrasphaera australiensis]